MIRLSLIKIADPEAMRDPGTAGASSGLRRSG
jgi:hypothetical protein